MKLITIEIVGIILLSTHLAFIYPNNLITQNSITSNTELTTNCTCGVTNKDIGKVVRGSKTLRNEYPLMAGLVRIGGNIFCGGVVITQRHVLTVAHCIARYQPIHIGIHVGHHNYEEIKENTTLLRPSRFFIHEDFKVQPSAGRKYDIAVILLVKSIAFNRNVGPVCLPSQKIRVEGQSVTVLGWGKTEHGRRSDVLLKTNLSIRPLKICLPANPKLELKYVHQLCTYRFNTDACQGDSGGPLLWLDKDINRYTLVGLVSYGNYCAVHPAVNTDVHYFMPWIQSVISRTTKLKTCGKILKNKA